MITKCNQFACAYNPDNDMQTDKKQHMLCPCCPRCGTGRWLINSNCKKCIKCENIPNHIRSEDDGRKEAEQIVIPIPPVELMQR